MPSRRGAIPRFDLCHGTATEKRLCWRHCCDGRAVMAESARKQLVHLRLNGRWRDDAIAENQLLVDYLREVVRLTGTKVGCDTGECGACTVLADGQPVPSCLVLSLRCDGRSIETIEGLAAQNRPHPLHRAFHEMLGTQCGFCTPGMILAAEALLRRNSRPSQE